MLSINNDAFFAPSPYSFFIYFLQKIKPSSQIAKNQQINN
ncbi:hypothetical protein AsAng_0005680 [Aureispira anguillae]|uniref:Uncharacterized protein n=1 Tax=Aureispira anguillae TaxID=2864201 RepID=A0A915YB70_9BACT|nr:hypothetical protein AsAng_0005680 [Aureispira anguillae]